MPQAAGSAQLGAARAAAIAALAAEAGLERQASAVPPALYAYDPDIGRLAVTTPAYNTAIVPVSQGAFPYGGIDLARLYDGEQEVAATIGGRAPGAFGLTVRRPGGGPRLATQAGAGRLRLTRAPRGVGASRSARRAYAGPFSDLRAIGRVRAGRRSATTRYRFTPGAIEGRWTAAPGRFDAALRFPSWGAGARVVAELADGTALELGRRPLPVAGVLAFHVVSAYSGYRVVPLRVPPGATARLERARPQPSAPLAGPTLALMARRARVDFAARLVVDGVGG